MYINIQEVKQRTDKILENPDPEVISQRIREAINDDYTLDRCYSDLMMMSIIRVGVISKLIVYQIEQNNLEHISCILDSIQHIKHYEFRDLIRQKKFTEIFLENFDENVSKLNEGCKEELIIYLINNKRDLLIDKIRNTDLIKNLGSDARSMVFRVLLESDKEIDIVIENLSDFFYEGFEFDIITSLIEKGVPKETFFAHKKDILSNSYGEDLLYFIKWLSENNEYSKEDMNLQTFIELLYYNIADNKKDINFLIALYYELLKKQNLDIKDIELLGEGEYSTVYKVGDFCVKVGDERENDKIPYHRRLLQPLVRETTYTLTEEGIFIELQNAVDKDWYEGLSDYQINEELYKIYKEMRKDGIIWTDIKRENVGRLLKQNTTNYSIGTLEGDLDSPEMLKEVENEMKVSNDAVGIIGGKDEKPLQAGELVIIDSDLIYSEDEIDIEEEMTPMNQPMEVPSYIVFERRYKHELELQQNEK